MKLHQKVKAKNFYTDTNNKSKSIFLICIQEDFQGEVLVSLDFGGLNINTCKGLQEPSADTSD